MDHLQLHLKTVARLGLVLWLSILAAACSRLDPPGPQQPLLIGLPSDPVFSQAAAPSEGMQGFIHDLGTLFAKSLGVDVKFIIAPDTPSLIEMVRKGKIHLAAAFPATQGEAEMRYTPPVQESRQLVVQHASALRLGSLSRLSGKDIAVMPGAPQAQALRSLNLDPPPNIIAPATGDELAMLESVAQRRHALAATDELHFNIAANFYPDLDIAVVLPEKVAYVWAFHANQPALRDQAAEFIESVKADGTLRRLNDRYFGHIRRLDTRDIQVFLDHVRVRLPDYRHLFQEAQEITGIDWRLIAALAYQESKWDPLATSPTNVRGMMMLTEDTADRLRVGNRLDARESTLAGAKYLALLMDELPEDIKQPDRLWLALAAYNLGMGHLNGARHFAPQLKRDPNLWVDMKQVMPMMAKPEYYTRLKSGRARGGEAVIMVENIRNYFDVLSRFEAAHFTDKPAPKKSAVKKKKNRSDQRGRSTSSPPR